MENNQLKCGDYFHFYFRCARATISKKLTVIGFQRHKIYSVFHFHLTTTCDLLTNEFCRKD